MALAANRPVTLDLEIDPQLEVETQWSHHRTGNAVSFTRFVLFIDNQSSLAVLVKSRSSFRKLNAVARKTAAILLCTLSRPLYAYTDTDRNPADASSMPRRGAPIVQRFHRATVSVMLNTRSQHRLQSRRQKGSLLHLRVQLRARCRHNDAVAAFSTWLHDEGQSPSPDKDGLDAQLCEYLERLWHEGRSRVLVR